MGYPGDAGVAHPGRVVDRRGVDVQRDGRIPAAEPDALAGEAVAADLQQFGGEFDEFTQVGRADAVIACGSSGSGGRTDPQHLTGRQRLQDWFRGGRRRIGMRGPKPLRRKQRCHK
ncbi:hypothetical protein MINTMi198_03510 [Mycobacterium intracellulare M.i.198]|nr:hypothetical protein MINTMi198_03510 [Mycobacterium intracellulare M.i.198]